LWFSIEIEQDEFVAFISNEALENHFKEPRENGDAVAAYRANQSIIDSVARQKFLRGFPRPIKLSSGDF